jgi:hypothetical protein
MMSFRKRSWRQQKELHGAKMCMVQWNRDTEDEATWKRKEDLRKTYHNILSKHRLNLEDKIHFKGIEL